MPINVCMTDFKKAVAGLMTQGDAEDLLDEAQTRAEARWRKRLEPRSQALNKSFEELIDERDAKLKTARLQSLQNVVKYHAALKQIDAFKIKSKGLLAYLGGVESNIPNSRVSIVSQMIADEKRIKSYFLTDLEKHGLSKLFETKGIDDELGGEIENPGTSKREDIRQLAKIMSKHQSYIVKELNAQSANIKEAEGYIARLKHNSGRMLKATGFGLKDAKLRTQLFLKNKGNWVEANKEFKTMAFDRWKNIIEPLVDKNKTFARTASEDEDRFYKSFYNAVTTGVHKVPKLETTSIPSGGSPLITRIGSNLANKLSADRVLHFNEGGWVKYNKEYGYDTIHDAYISQLEKSGQAVGLMKKSGASPRTFLTRLHRQIQEMGETRQEPGFKKNMIRAQNLIDTIIGDNDRPMDGLAGSIFRVFKLVQYASKTGGIVLSSTPDLGNMTSALRQHNIPALKVYPKALEFVAKGAPKGELKQLLLQIGIYSDGALGSLMTKFGSVDTPYGFFSKLMKINDKLNLINRWDNGTIHTMGYMLSNKLASIIDTTFEDILPAEKRTLEISGVDKKTWSLIQENKHALTTFEDKNFLTPDMANEFTDESIAKIYYGNKAGKTTPLKIKQAKENVRDALGIYFTDQTSYGKIMPNASDRALMLGGTKANTFAGQIWRMITMFHSFHFASTRRTLGRFMFGNGAENLHEALIQGKADFKGFGNFMLQSLPLGYLSYASKLMARGLMPPPLNEKKTWEESMVRGGMGFAYGSYFADAFNSQHDFISSVAGPGLKTVFDVVKLLNKIADGKDASKAAAWLVQGNMPFINIFYLKAALDHTILNAIHQKIDPNYIYNLRQKAIKNNQHYLWQP